MLSKTNYSFGLRFLHDLDKEMNFVQISSIRKSQDCLVFLAKIIRLWAFYFWAAFKNYRWINYPVFPMWAGLQYF